MIKVECDRCRNQEESDGRAVTTVVGPIRKTEYVLPQGWHRVGVPDDDEAIVPTRWELCPGCVNALREFLGGNEIAARPADALAGGFDTFGAWVASQVLPGPGEFPADPPAVVDCGACGDAFEPRQLTKHMQEKHNGGGGTTRCAYCKGNPQVANPLFRKHMDQEHPGAPDFPNEPGEDATLCNECGKSVVWDRADRSWHHRHVKDMAGVGYGHNIRPIPRDEYESGERL